MVGIGGKIMRLYIIIAILLLSTSAFAQRGVIEPISVSIPDNSVTETKLSSELRDKINNISDNYRQVISMTTSTDTDLYLQDGARSTIYNISLLGNTDITSVKYNADKYPQDGDSLILRITAVGGDMQISFNDTTFLYGKSLILTDITETQQDETDIVGLQWYESKKKWIVLSISKGF